MEEEKIIRIQFYQAVYVGSAVVTNMSLASPATALKKATLKFIPNNGVLVTNEVEAEGKILKHRTLVPLNNVAYMQFETPTAKPAKPAKPSA